MKIFYALIILLLFQNCSFDNKTGIWKNENEPSAKEKNIFSEFKNLSSSNEVFNEIIVLRKNYKFKIPNKITNLNWRDVFYDKTNNIKNFTYNELNQLAFKTKKLSKYNINNLILFENNNVIFSDQKGNINIFSSSENKAIIKFNFYKKKYKNINKSLNLIVENNIIYVSDNIGYLYAYDYSKNKILWAQNYKIPFGSNIKIFKNKLIAANQNNILYFFNKFDGQLLKFIPTEDTKIKNEFINNISLNEKNTYFLNTYGSLYAINNETLKIIWYLNLNPSLDITPSNLFRGTQLVNYGNTVSVSTNQFTYVLESNTGAIIYKKNFISSIKPILLSDYLFTVTKNNLLVAMDLKDGSVIYSYNINRKIAELLKIKKKNISIKDVAILNGKIFIFLHNSYVLKFNINGSLEDAYKLPTKIGTHPIFVEKSILYLSSKNKLSIID
tara:strand:+ start:3232 stop:4557 length:1326 start_codon:yes stop_codon:yes gene_type:complete